MYDLFREELRQQVLAMMADPHLDALAYARERHAFGKSLTGFQVVRHKLADMAINIDAARLLAWRGAGAGVHSADVHGGAGVHHDQNFFVAQPARKGIDFAPIIHATASPAIASRCRPCRSAASMISHARRVSSTSESSNGNR